MLGSSVTLISKQTILSIQCSLGILLIKDIVVVCALELDLTLKKLYFYILLYIIYLIFYIKILLYYQYTYIYIFSI